MVYTIENYENPKVVFVYAGAQEGRVTNYLLSPIVRRAAKLFGFLTDGLVQEGEGVGRVGTRGGGGAGSTPAAGRGQLANCLFISLLSSSCYWSFLPELDMRHFFRVIRKGFFQVSAISVTPSPPLSTQNWRPEKLCWVVTPFLSYTVLESRA